MMTIFVFVLAYIMLFTRYFFIFGPMMFIYLFIAFGFISIITDLTIAKPWKKMPDESGAHYRKKEEEEEGKEGWVN